MSYCWDVFCSLEYIWDHFCFFFYSIHFVCLKTFVNYCNKTENLSPKLVSQDKSEALQRSATSLVALWVSVPSVISSLPYLARCPNSSRLKLAQTFHRLNHFGPSYLVSAPLVLSWLPRTHLGRSYYISL